MKDWTNRILIRNLQKKRIPISREKIAKLTRKILKEKKLPPNSGLSILFVNKEFIRELNLRYLKKKFATDVLAFSLGENPENFLGDIVISIDSAIENSSLFKTTLKKELLTYLVHGILHLLGYKDKTKRQKKIMESEQNRILNLYAPSSIK